MEAKVTGASKRRRSAREQRARGRRLRLILAAAGTLDVILSHVRNGGSLIELCDTWNVRYSDVIAWVRADKVRGDAYDAATRDRSEFTDEMVLAEIRAICRFDIRKLYDEHGALIPIHLLDAETARMVQTVEVDELFKGKGDMRSSVGHTSKVKVYDKLKGLELAGRNRKLYTDNVEHSLDGKLEDILARSYETPAPEAPPAA